MFLLINCLNKKNNILFNLFLNKSRSQISSLINACFKHAT